MANSKLTGMLLLLAVSIFSCRKDDNASPERDKKLVVKLENHLIEVNEIDSANVVLRKGAGTPYFFRLQKGVNNLEALIEGLPTGQYSADFDIYTTSDATNKSYQFVAIKAVTIDNSAAVINIDGPKELGPDGWSARKVVATSNKDIVVIIPLDVTDPYFEIRIKGTKWDFFSVERLGLLGSGVVAHETWSCNNNCLRPDKMLFDNTTFLPFTNIIKNSNWTKNEIIITVGNHASQQYNEFIHTWNN